MIRTERILMYPSQNRYSGLYKLLNSIEIFIPVGIKTNPLTDLLLLFKNLYLYFNVQ